MSRIRPEDLPKPKKVSRTQAKKMLADFSASGVSKYDVYVDAAKNLNPGEALDTMVLPENVITSIQKKFREQGLNRNAGYYVISKTTGTEKKGYKSLLIGKYESAPKATRSAKKPTASTRKSSTRRATTSRAKAAAKPTAKATTASRAKKAAKATSAKKTVAKKTAAKRTVAKKTVAKKTVAKKTVAKPTVAKKATAKKTSSQKNSSQKNSS